MHFIWNIIGLLIGILIGILIIRYRKKFAKLKWETQVLNKPKHFKESDYRVYEFNAIIGGLAIITFSLWFFLKKFL